MLVFFFFLNVRLKIPKNVFAWSLTLCKNNLYHYEIVKIFAVKVPKLHFLQLFFWLPPHSLRADWLDKKNFMQNFVKLSVMTRFFCVTCTVSKQKRGKSFAFLLCPAGPFFYFFLGRPRALIKHRARCQACSTTELHQLSVSSLPWPKKAPKRTSAFVFISFSIFHAQFGCVKLWVKPLAPVESTLV